MEGVWGVRMTQSSLTHTPICNSVWWPSLRLAYTYYTNWGWNGTGREFGIAIWLGWEALNFSFSRHPISPLWHWEVPDFTENPARRLSIGVGPFGGEVALSKGCKVGFPGPGNGRHSHIWEDSLESERFPLNQVGTGSLLPSWKKMTPATGWTRDIAQSPRLSHPSLPPLHELMHSFFTLVSLIVFCHLQWNMSGKYASY